MSDPTTKAELLEKMETGYTAFEAEVAGISPAKSLEPGVNGDWSIKDILFHLATWQGRTAQALEAVRLNKQPELSPSISNDEEMNRFNEQNFVSGRARSLEEVWQDFRSSYQLLHRQVVVLSDEDLFTAGRFSWMKGHPLWFTVEGNAYGHYAEHQPDIEAWLARQQG